MDNNIDAIFAAMADPTRRAVIERLGHGPASVSDLHAPHDIALPTFLKHLRKLEDAGLVTSKKVGRVRIVAGQSKPLNAAEGWIAQQRRNWETRLDSLQALAAQMERTKS